MSTHRQLLTRAISLIALAASEFAPFPAFATAQEPEAKAEAKQQAADPVIRGRVTDESGVALADVLVRIAIPATNMHFVDATSKLKRVEVRTDPAGTYRAEIPGIASRTTVSLDAMKPGFRRLTGTIMRGDVTRVEVEPGGEKEVNLILKPALYFSGMVVDEQGKPIPGVKIDSLLKAPRSNANVERTTTNRDGTFELFSYPTQPHVFPSGVSHGTVLFNHPDYVEGNIDDVYTLAEGERTNRVVVLKSGRKLAGTVVNSAGKPVPNAMVRAVSVTGECRRATTTEAGGKFALRALIDDKFRLTVRSLEIKQKAQMDLVVDADKGNLEVQLQPINLPANLKSYDVLGMKLVDVTPELQSAYDLGWSRGALILDPGLGSERLGIGQLEEGNNFITIGTKRIANVREFVDQILAGVVSGQDADKLSVPVIYNYNTPTYEAANRQVLKLTRDDLAQLRALSERFAAELK